MKIIVSEEIETVCPKFVGACVEANVQNSPYCQELWDEINALGEKYRDTLTTESLKEMSGIAATRKVYRACGKDPSRYRPASEALIRRMLQGKQLYQRDTLVDLVNLASIAFGYSIGGFDADKFEGDTLTLGVGKAGEPYEGIGRGNINIEGLPVYRDSLGGVGTPTSDNERTKMMSDTSHLVVLINGYDGNEQQCVPMPNTYSRCSKNTVRAMEALISYISNGGLSQIGKLENLTSLTSLTSLNENILQYE